MEKSISLMMLSLNEMRKTETMTDVIINCGKQSFCAHSLVLNSVSSVFRERLSSGTNIIQLDEVDSKIMQTIWTAIYTGKIANIFLSNMRQLLHAFKFLQTEHVYALCCDVSIDQITVNNSVELWFVAEEFGNESMRNQVIAYIIKNSFDVAKSTQVEHLLAKQIMRLSKAMSELSADIGHQVRLILGWLKVDIRNRRKDADAMLSSMNYNNGGNMFLKYVLDEQEHLPKTSQMITNILTLRSQYERGASLPKVLESGQAIFFFGRYCGESFFQAFSPKWQIWSKIVELPFNLTDDVATVVFDEAIYFIGGGSYYWETPQSTKLLYRTHGDVIKFKFRTNSAKYIAKLNNPRADIRTAVLGDKIYAIGGYRTRQAYNFAERYNFQSKVWENLQPMRNAHRAPYVVALHGFLYVFGGNGCLAVEKYDPSQNQWTELTRLPGASIHFWPFGVTWKDKILIKTSEDWNTFQFLVVDDERIGYRTSPKEVLNCTTTLKYMCGEYKDEQVHGIIVADDSNHLMYFDPETKRWTSLPGKLALSCVWWLTVEVSNTEDKIPERNESN